MAWDTNRQEGDVLTAQDWNQAVQEIKSKQSRLNVVDSLDSTSSVDVLSAKQGKVLNDRITDVNTAVENVSDKIDKLPTGIYYGQYDSEEDLEDIQVTTKGYAYISSTDPAVYYIYLYDGNSWTNSGNKFVTTNLETDLSTKSQTKAPTTKAVQEGIEAINVTTEQEFTSTQKETARTNINAQENIASMADKLPVVAALNNRTADVVQVTGEVKALGYKLLNPALSFAEQVTEDNTIYEIRDRFNLNSISQSMPANSIIKFNGGSIVNGTLSGDVRFMEPLDLANIGVVYNDSTKGSNNSTALAILNGITSDVELDFHGNVYVNGNLPIILGSLKIKGNGYSLYLHGVSDNGFRVNKNATIENLRVIGDDISDVNKAYSWFLVMRNYAYASEVLIQNCYFTGTLRPFQSYKLADASFTKYFESIQIINNVFENIIEFGASNSGIVIADTNFKSLIFKNNKIHNFFSAFLNTALTNNSSEETNVENFCPKYGRYYLIEGNSVYNDLDWKPWIKSPNKDVAYFCFALLEKGNADYRNNSCINIIGKPNSGNTVYEIYASVDKLYYENNYVENCIGIGSYSGYNEILKGKVGKERYYRKSKFVYTDISGYFEEITATPSLKFNDTQGNIFDVFSVEDCSFSIERLSCASGYSGTYKQLYFNRNLLQITYIVPNTSTTSSTLSILNANSTDVQVAEITDNIIDVDDIYYNDDDDVFRVTYLLAQGSLIGSNKKIKISNNVIRNLCIFYSSTSNKNNVYIIGNRITFTINKTDSKGLLTNRIMADYVIKDNTISLANGSFNIEGKGFSEFGVSDIIFENNKIIFPSYASFEFQKIRSYTSGTYVKYKGNFYKFTSSKTPTSTENKWDSSKVTQVPDFSDSESYNTNTYVQYSEDETSEKKLYKFTESKSAGAWDDTKVEEVLNKNTNNLFYLLELRTSISGIFSITSSVLDSSGNQIEVEAVANCNTSRATGGYIISGSSQAKWYCLPSTGHSDVEIVTSGYNMTPFYNKAGSSQVVYYGDSIYYKCVSGSDTLTVSFNVKKVESLTDFRIPPIGRKERPTFNTTNKQRANIGYSYFDRNIGKPIYYNGSIWVDSNGESVGLQVSDTSVLIGSAANESKTINVFSADAITAIAQNPDGTTADLWLTASVGTLTNGAYPVTLTATSANTTSPRGAKVIISNGTDVEIVNVVQSY